LEKIKVMTIFGTRPEAVKMAPLIKEFEKNEAIDSIVCVTAQHREMLDQVLNMFQIKPQYDLDIMKDRQTLVGITNRVLSGLDEIISKVEPDLILVHGDTTTTFAGSLAAFYNKIKLGHVEAGLRSNDKYFPYPEEINRKLTAVLADMHFAPTSTSKKNLLNEGIKEASIYITGNTAIDAMLETVDESYEFECEELNKIDYKNKKVIMVTAHRRENWGEPLENICRALKRVALSNPEVEIVYLVHLNPIVKETAYGILSDIPNVHLLPPLEIKGSHNLINRCYMILSDSGGLQEEAPHLGKPLLLLRGVTERPEAVVAGTVRIVGTDEDRIFEETIRLLQHKESYNRMATAINPYGDGKAAKRILEAILFEFGLSKGAPEDFSSRR
jgi:UDP-N-acetylglucosamine 2-epimerase (non-hydrolysing)